MNQNVTFAIAGLVVGAVAAFVILTIVRPSPPSPLLPGCAPGLSKNDRCVDVEVKVSGSTVDIAPVLTPDGMSSPGLIVWTLKSPAGYTFQDGAIDFANPGGSPINKPVANAGEFHNCMVRPSSGNLQYQCNNKRSLGSNGIWAYKVTVTGPGAPLVQDPFILNN